MAFGSPLGNIKGFATSRPPLVVFTLCLTAFALTTLSLAYFVRENESISNQDIRLDWSTFLKHLSDLDFCVSPDDSLPQQRVPNISRYNEEADDGYGNVSIAVSASLSLIQHFSAFSHNITTIAGILPLGDWSSLCMSEPSSGEMSLNVTMTLPQNLSHPQDVCVTFSGPRSILPISRSPPACVPSPVHTGNQVVSARLESRGRSADALGERVDDDWCRGGAVMRLAYRLNPQMNVILSLRDRSMINLHLIHTSYFLFVMAMTLVCYALIKGKNKPKVIIVDKVPLDP